MGFDGMKRSSKAAHRHRFVRGLAAVLLSVLTACNAVPNAGPRSPAVSAGAVALPGAAARPAVPDQTYALVNLDRDVVAALDADPLPFQFSDLAADYSASEVRLGIGDVVSITIFESQAGGLFIPAEAGSRPGNFVQLPSQQIDRGGNVTVPFGGAIRAAGRTAAELEAAIAARLSRRALDPQAVVTLVERRSSIVSVIGDVGQSLRFALDPGGERLLGAIARAGGTRFPPHETLVTLQRAGRVERAFLSDIAVDPRLNLQLAPDDSLILSREQRYFLALGAVGSSATLTQLNRRVAFEDRQLSLADALARAGGLQDDRADATSVFLFREERGATLRRMGFQVGDTEQGIPTIYRADLSGAGMMFLTRRFPIRPNDMIYVSTAASTELQKFLQLVLPMSQIGANIRVITR